MVVRLGPGGVGEGQGVWECVGECVFVDRMGLIDYYCVCPAASFLPSAGTGTFSVASLLGSRGRNVVGGRAEGRRQDHRKEPTHALVPKMGPSFKARCEKEAKNI